ncbi:unnamed protein product, partial [Prorocentrum cordatum]
SHLGAPPSLSLVIAAMSACARERSLAPPDGHAQDERWHCTQCGFWNKPTNTVCGGTGPMGCGQAGDGRPLSAGPGAVGCAAGLGERQGWRRLRRSRQVGLRVRLRQSADQHCLWRTGGGPLGCKQQRPGCVGAARTPADDGDSWTCSCGFVNSAKNVQCGGKGVLGCKKARAEQDRVVADLKQYREQMNQRSVSTQARS